MIPTNGVCTPNGASTTGAQNASSGECSRKEFIQKVHTILDEMDTSKVEDCCCCTDPTSPPEGKKVVTTACLDGKDGVMTLVTSGQKDRYIWVPPHTDNRPTLDPSDSCYAPTVAKHLYDCYIGLSSSGPRPPSSTLAGQPGGAGQRPGDCFGVTNGTPGQRGACQCTPTQAPERSPITQRGIQFGFAPSATTQGCTPIPSKDVGVQFCVTQSAPDRFCNPMTNTGVGVQYGVSQGVSNQCCTPVICQSVPAQYCVQTDNKGFGFKFGINQGVSEQCSTSPRCQTAPAETNNKGVGTQFGMNQGVPDPRCILAVSQSAPVKYCTPSTSQGVGVGAQFSPSRNTPARCCTPANGKGLRPGAPSTSLHQQGASAPKPERDYCEDPNFVPPEPLGHQAWTNEPGGTCRYPEYCKAHCFDHSPDRDWARH